MAFRTLKRAGSNLARRYRMRRFKNVKKPRSDTVYESSPDTAAIVQLFNKRDNAEQIANYLVSSSFQEVIFIDDGSSDNPLPMLEAILTRKNDFIIRSNDIFEVRSYSRAIDFCRAKYIALLQDDDFPPEGDEWILNAVGLFEQNQKLAILGGRDGLALNPPIGTVPGENYEGEEYPSVASYNLINHAGGMRVEMDFRFVEVVNRAPMWVRKSSLLDLGGIDQTFAPFQCDDVDLCLRAWLKGYTVGLYSTDFIRDVGVGGMRLFNSSSVPLQARKNWAKIYRRYGSYIEQEFFSKAVSSANTEIGL